MDLAQMKRIARTMAESGGLVPEFLTDDFEFIVVAHPTSHPGAGRSHPASEILPGLERARQLLRYPDEYGPGDGLKAIVRSMTAEGDRVVVEVETHAVPRANPANRYINYNVAIYVFRDGKVAQARIYEDTAYVQRFEATAAELRNAHQASGSD
jgi:ketosteroid isomerase-like protein